VIPFWKVYYGNGETFSSEDGFPEDAPCGGVICVAWYDEDNRRHLAHASDYYIYAGEGRWMGCDAAGFWQYMGEPGFKVVKFGRMIGDKAFRSIMSHAMSDLPIEGVAR
jgi:hypothetical protein